MKTGIKGKPVSKSTQIGKYAFIAGLIGMAAIGGLAYLDENVPEIEEYLPYLMVAVFIPLFATIMYLNYKHKHLKVPSHEGEDWTREAALLRNSLYKYLSVAGIGIGISVLLVIRSGNMTEITFAGFFISVLIAIIGMSKNLKCPACGEIPPSSGTGTVTLNYQYCPHCGAKLK